MKQKRLLIYTDCYTYGGSERLMRFLFENKVVNENYDVYFAFRKHRIYNQRLSKEIDVESARVIGLNVISFDNIFFYMRFSIKNKILSLFLRAILKVVDIFFIHPVYNYILFLIQIVKIRPDVVHINNGGYPAARTCNQFAIAAKLSGVQRIIYQVNNQAAKASVFSFVRDSIFSNVVNAFVVSSELAKSTLKKRFYFTQIPVNVIRNIVQVKKITTLPEDIKARLQLPTDSFVLLSIGFLSKRKGQMYIIEAVNKLVNTDSLDFIKLLIIGEGEEEQSLRKLIKEYRLEKNIFLLGYRDDYYEYMNACDVFILSSVANEDLPLVLVEALIMDKTIIASGFSSYAEILEDCKNSLIVSPNEFLIAGEIYEKIKYLLDNRSQIKELTGHNKSAKEMFSPERYGHELLSLYAQ